MVMFADALTPNCTRNCVVSKLLTETPAAFHGAGSFSEEDLEAEAVARGEDELRLPQVQSQRLGGDCLFYLLTSNVLFVKLSLWEFHSQILDT